MRPAVFMILAVWLCAAFGCAALDQIDTTSRTGGHRLTLDVRTGDSDSIAIYRVQPDGIIEFAGGRDALLGSTTWTGTLTDEEIDTLVTLLRDHQWYTQPFESTGQPDDLHQSGVVRGPTGFRRFEVTGEHPRIAPVRTLLERAAGRRNERVLDALPKPSNVPAGDDSAGEP